MSTKFATPQEAEDAFYDAIDEADIQTMMAVWDESDDVLCLLPMMPAHRGRHAIRATWENILQSGSPLEIQINHLSWIEHGDFALHLVEELFAVPDEPAPQRIYATNIYRKDEHGWRLLMHQNSPTPPAPGLQIPERG
jgi:ketosteroid isomerase-like protein